MRLTELIRRIRILEYSAHHERYDPVRSSRSRGSLLRQESSVWSWNQSRRTVIGTLLPGKGLAVCPHFYACPVMDRTKLLPVSAKSWKRVTFSDTTDFILICNDVHFQAGNLLLITRIVKIRVKYPIRGNKDLCGRGKLTGTVCKGIDSLDSIIRQHRTETVLDRQIPAMECRMFSIDPRQFLHHLHLTSLDLRIAEIVILVLRPSGTHEHLHAMFSRSIHDRIHRALPPYRVHPRHYLRRIISHAFICHRHEHKVLHTHLLHLSDLGRPHLRIGSVDVWGIGVFVTDILIRKIQECSRNRKSLKHFRTFRGSCIAMESGARAFAAAHNHGSKKQDV